MQRVALALTGETAHLFCLQLLAPTEQFYFLYLTKISPQFLMKA